MILNLNGNVDQLCPAAIHTGNASDLSDRYVHIQTTDVVDALSAHGFKVVNQKQSKRENTAKHGLILVNREMGFLDSTGSENFATVSLFNSHDGTSATRLIAGFYRLICSNGMVSGQVSDSVRVRHSAKGLATLTDTVGLLPEKLQAYAETILKLQNRILTEDEQLYLAWNVFNLVSGQRSIRQENLLTRRRNEDMASDAYTVANVIQENIIRGGSLSAQSSRRLRAVTNFQSQTVLTQLVLNETLRIAA